MTQFSRRTQQGFLLITVLMILGVLATVALMLSGSTSLDNSLVAKHAEGATLDYVLESGLEHAKWRLFQNSVCTGYTDLPNTAFGANSYGASYSASSGSPLTITATGFVPSGATRVLVANSVKAHQSPQSTTLQPGSEGMDVWFTSTQPAWNYGAHAMLNINSSAQRALIQFDMTSLPADVRINSAIVELYLDNQNSVGTIDIHRATNSWLEGSCTGAGCTADGATWNTSDGIALWSTAGADHDVDPLATQMIGSAGNWYSWDISYLAASWVNGELPNYGVLLIGSNGVSSQFASSDDTDASLHPKLTISYACECGVDCNAAPAPTCDADFIPSSKLSEFSPSSLDSDYFRGITYLPEGETFKASIVPAGGQWLTVDSQKEVFLVDPDGTKKESCTLSGGAALWSDGIAYISSGAQAGAIAVVFNGTSTNYVQYIDSDCGALSTFSTDGFGAAIPSGIAHLATTASGTYDDFLAVTDRGTSKTVHIVDQNGAESLSLDVSSIVGDLSGVAHLPGTDKLILADSVNSKVHVIDFMNFAGASLAEYALDQFGVSTPEGIAINGTTCDHVVGAQASDNIVALNQSVDLLAHWKFDEKIGLVAVDTAGGHHGDLLNGPTWNPDGKIDDALSFDGVDDYVEVPHDDTLSLTSAFTISAWVRNESPSIASSYRIISKESVGANDNYWLSFQSRALWMGVGGSFFSPPVTFDPDVWYHVAATFDDVANRIVMYVDGIEVLSQTTTATVTPNNDPIRIGGNWQGFKFWDGLLDDVRIYDRALDASEILDISGISGGGGGGGLLCDDTLLDEFNVESYGNSDGTLVWTTDWLEIGENDGPTSGNERVVDSDSEFHLRVKDSDGGVEREADLSAGVEATLSFEYRRDSFDNPNDYVTVDVSSDGGSTWIELDRISGPGTDATYVPVSYDISPHIATNTRIRFLSSSNLGGGDEFFADDVQIELCVAN